MYLRDCKVCAYKYKAQAYYSIVWNKSNSTLNSIEFNWCMILSYLRLTTATASSLAFKTLSPTAYNQLWTLLLVWSLAVIGMTKSRNSFETRFTSFESLNGSPLSETSSPTKSWMTLSALNTSSHSSQDLPQTNYRYRSQLCSSSSTTCSSKSRFRREISFSWHSYLVEHTTWHCNESKLCCFAQMTLKTHFFNIS